MSTLAQSRYTEPAAIATVFTGVGNNLTETTRQGTVTGYSSNNGVTRLQNQQVVDLTSQHLEYIQPEVTLPTNPFDGSTVTTFHFRPEGKIKDLSLHLRLKAASGKTIGINSPTPFMIRRYFWRFGQSTFEEPPMSNHYDALLLTRAPEYMGRKDPWGYGNWIEHEEVRHYHPAFQTLENTGVNADIDFMIPLNSFWVNKEIDPDGTNLPPFTLEITWANYNRFSTASAVTDIETVPSETFLQIRTERSSRPRAVAIRNLFTSQRVHTRCILPQKVTTQPQTYQVDGLMKFPIGGNLQGLLTGLIFHLSPTDSVGSQTAANEVWTVTDAATAGAQCALGISQLGVTKPLAYNASASTLQSALDELLPGRVNDGYIAAGTGFLSNASSTITFVGGLGAMPHGSEGRNVFTVLDVDAATGGTSVTYNKTTAGVRVDKAEHGIPFKNVLLQVNGQPGVISSREIPRQVLLEYTKEGILNPDAVIEHHDNAYYLLPFCKNFGESYATGRLYGVLPITNTNVELHINTLPAAKLPGRFTYSGSWYLHCTAYKVVEFVSIPARGGTRNTVALNFITPSATV